MKLIDLFNTPLDRLPKKIKVEDRIYTLYINEANQHYYQDDKCKYFWFSISCFDDLNEEVEIIKEEKKIPEKIGVINYAEDQATALIHHKVDEIIDYLQSKGE